MKCPIDSATLVMSERSGVEIDYCPECRGVWLDRGELDKILERAESELASARPVTPDAPAAPPTPAAGTWGGQAPQYGQPVEDPYRDRGYDNRAGYRPKKKESWLSELFD